MVFSWQPVLRHSAEDIRFPSPKITTHKMKHVKHTTKAEDAFGTNLCREWECNKGDTYLLEVGEAWTCTRWGKDGCSKTFTVIPDEASGKIWWGHRASFYCEVGVEANSDVLIWCRPGARTPRFVWRAKPGATRSPSWRSESTGSGGDSTAELSCRSSSRPGSAEKIRKPRPPWRPREDGAEQGDGAGDQPCEKLAGKRSGCGRGAVVEGGALTTADVPTWRAGADRPEEFGGPGELPRAEAVAASRHPQKRLVNIATKKELEEEQIQAAAGKPRSASSAASPRVADRAEASRQAHSRPRLPEGFLPPPGLEPPQAALHEASESSPPGSPKGTSDDETRAGSDSSHASDINRGPLDGSWFDSCGKVGTIAGSVMHWAHHPDDSDGATEVVLRGATVHMTFLGQMLSGVLRGEQIIWSKSDVWRRVEPEPQARILQ
ncbi:unnamed protein product [Prorocentrum cordatum]|uniref:Altered inheritance of mitochondria protein 24, mitochondrial n=1 Tax=Prorocentrum cordatum TaxID=2364126 RepID=A0ABN9USQ7_9DINO|nr:unnamed protein product [Polarella glacialis]